jgi:hypothetical protein
LPYSGLFLAFPLKNSYLWRILKYSTFFLKELEVFLHFTPFSVLDIQSQGRNCLLTDNSHKWKTFSIQGFPSPYSLRPDITNQTLTPGIFFQSLQNWRK